jgi:hypothetical protein
MELTIPLNRFQCGIGQNPSAVRSGMELNFCWDEDRFRRKPGRSCGSTEKCGGMNKGSCAAQEPSFHRMATKFSSER